MENCYRRRKMMKKGQIMDFFETNMQKCQKSKK
jgi:hypothetical protein